MSKVGAYGDFVNETDHAASMLLASMCNVADFGSLGRGWKSRRIQGKKKRFGRYNARKRYQITGSDTESHSSWSFCPPSQELRLISRR